MKKGAIFLAALAMAIPGSIAEAQSGSGVFIRIVYLSGAGGVPVGEFVQFCDGSSTWNGDITEHSQYYQYDC
jgi:hypothetical protein